MYARSAFMLGGRNVIRMTISGMAGSGTSTVAEAVSKRKGWRHLNGGSVFREEARRRNLDLESFTKLCAEDLSIDRALDARLKEALLDPEGPEIVESRLAGWWAFQESLDCIRLHLTIDLEVRAQRIAGREYLSISDAASKALARDQADSHRLGELYGIEIVDDAPYTHTIDTSFRDATSIVDEVIGLLGGDL